MLPRKTKPQYIFGKVTPTRMLVYFSIFIFIFYIGYKTFIVNRTPQTSAGNYNNSAEASVDPISANSQTDLAATKILMRESLIEYFPEEIDIETVKEQDENTYKALVAYAAEKNIATDGKTLPRDVFVDAVISEIDLEPYLVTTSDKATDTGDVAGSSSGRQWNYYSPVATTNKTASNQTEEGSCLVNATEEIVQCDMPSYQTNWVCFKSIYQDPTGCTREGEFCLPPTTKIDVHYETGLRSPTVNAEGQMEQIQDFPTYEEPVNEIVGSSACKPDGTVMPPGILREISQALTGSAQSVNNVRGTLATTYASDNSGDNGGKGYFAHRLVSPALTQNSGGDTDFTIARDSNEPLAVKPVNGANVKVDKLKSKTSIPIFPLGGNHDTVKYSNEAYDKLRKSVFGSIAQCAVIALGYTDKCTWMTQSLGNDEETDSHNLSLSGLNTTYTMWKLPDDPIYFDENGHPQEHFEDAITTCTTSSGETVYRNVGDNFGARITFESYNYRRALPPYLSNFAGSSSRIESELTALHLEDGAFVPVRGPQVDTPDQFYESNFDWANDPIVDSSTCNLKSSRLGASK